MTREEVYEEFKLEWNYFLKGVGLTDPKVREKNMSNNEDLRKVVECNEYILNMLEEEQFINKPCVSGKVCEHDKNVILDKIRAEIEQRRKRYDGSMYYIETAREHELSWVLGVIDQYKPESEDKE